MRIFGVCASNWKLWASSQLGLDLSRFPFFVLRYELTLGERTLDPILRVVAWSLNVPELEQLYWYSIRFCYPKNSCDFHQIQSWELTPCCILNFFPCFPPNPVLWSESHVAMWHIVCTGLHQVGYIDKWPTIGPNGEPWNRRKGSFPESFALVECRGDWKWHLELWGLKRNYKATNLCHRCVACTRAGPNQ